MFKKRKLKKFKKKRKRKSHTHQQITKNQEKASDKTNNEVSLNFPFTQTVL